MKVEASPKYIHYKDYRQPDFWIQTAHLKFDLGEHLVRVHSQLKMKRNTAPTSSKSAPLILDGEQLVLEKVTINGRTLVAGEFAVSATQLTIPNVPDEFTLETVTTTEPAKNLACEGLYLSGPTGNKIFCTQCEAESFRKITYFLDRPDVMAIFTVTIEADKTACPVLLSNGNPVSKTDLPGGRHQAVWHDPFKKPAYLFALVAGQLEHVEDTFKTRSGRSVTLQIFVRKGLEERCHHAMKSLQASMKWDEETYGLEYDLDIYMIVVAEDFNMGAMENKGLNVFNAGYVLANPQTATDTDYDSILAVVGHEYFHNWTGNRVTCRDWFQLSLKEGLTVFRDQRFSGDMGSEAVKRIEDVIRLRTNQFAEDAGPMAHPIRPLSYLSIDNFYTLTVYEKGAEVIRMIETIVGRAGFRKGLDLYFKRHDGQAVTTEDFVAAMADACNVDLEQFKNWYDQAGTPVITVNTEFDENKQTYTLHIEQSCPPTPGQDIKRPYHMPIAVGLLGPTGKDIPLELTGSQTSTPGEGPTTIVLHLREPKQSFTFANVKTRPVLSLLRGFSAPVKAVYEMTDEDLAFAMAHDSDAFARWETAQILTVRTIQNLVQDFQSKLPLREPKHLISAFGPILKDAFGDPNYISFLLSLPAEQYITQFFKTVDVDAIHGAREHVRKSIALAHKDELLAIYKKLAAGGTEGESVRKAGERSLRSAVLSYLVNTDDPKMTQLALKQRRKALNMTDELGALVPLSRVDSTERKMALDEFYSKWKHEPLVMNKWLAIQAAVPSPHTLARIQELSCDPIFDKNNPNKIYSLFLAFAKNNLVGFHEKSGAAYKFIADQVLDIDKRNPQVAARLVSPFNVMSTLDKERQALMRKELERITAQPGLSSNVFEIVTKALAN